MAHGIIYNPKLQTLVYRITGTSPLMLNKFVRLNQTYEEHFYRSKEGWIGIPVGFFRNALSNAYFHLCSKKRDISFLKRAILIDHDGADIDNEKIDLIRLEGEAKKYRDCCKVGKDEYITVLPRWEHWACAIHIRFDKDILTSSDVEAWLNRAGRDGGWAGWTGAVGTFEVERLAKQERKTANGQERKANQKSPRHRGNQEPTKQERANHA